MKHWPISNASLRFQPEAECEHTCRVGTTGQLSSGDIGSMFGDFASYGEGSNDPTHPVREKKPQSWGIHDMYINVGEWYRDWHGTHPHGALTDPTDLANGSSRVSVAAVGGPPSRIVERRSASTATTTAFVLPRVRLASRWSRFR